MFDTNVTIVGNVLTAPEWRRTTQSNTLVANFKVASTARRLDRDSGRWVDGNSLRVRVNCWRKLAEGVAASVMVGDPIVVVGRLYTRDWIDDTGNHRTLYELEAIAVGHDLSRGRSRFLRNRPTLTTSSVADADAENRVHGETTEPVPDAEAPAVPDDRPFDEEFELPGLRGAPGSGFPGVAGVPTDPRLFGGAVEPTSFSGASIGGIDTSSPMDDELAEFSDESEQPGDGDLDAVPDQEEGRPGMRPRRGRGRAPVPA